MSRDATRRCRCGRQPLYPLSTPAPPRLLWTSMARNETTRKLEDLATDNTMRIKCIYPRHTCCAVSTDHEVVKRKPVRLRLEEKYFSEKKPYELTGSESGMSDDNRPGIRPEDGVSDWGFANPVMRPKKPKIRFKTEIPPEPMIRIKPCIRPQPVI